MHHHYADIRSRITEPPRWWDENGTPRWGEFSPRATANIYARQAALVEIACQSCGERFRVAFSRQYAYDFRAGKPAPTLADEARAGSLHYGDPPNVGCCPAGATMNCLDLRVVEFWEHEHLDWTRRPDLEVPLADHDEVTAA